jgi:DNA-binding FadR family transcriptional regulator
MRLARTIEQEIIRRGWPVGEGLGSEAQLMDRYKVGRSVLREAVRILESRWVARPRPGPGGGLVVTAPDPDGVRDATRVFLDFARVQPDHLLETWTALETVAVRELTATVDAAGISRLRALVREDAPPSGIQRPGVAFHLEIARLAGNPAIDLFVRVLVDLVHTNSGPSNSGPVNGGPVNSGMVNSDPANSGHTSRGVAGSVRPRWDDPAHAEIVDAIVSGEAALAQYHVQSCIQRHAEEVRDTRTPRT